MTTNNAANNKTGATGTVLQGQGVGTASDFSTATYPSTASTSGNFIASDGTNFSSSAQCLGFFGDGSDGSQTFDGSSVILGITPSANTYTLARDIFLSSGTIDNGVSIITNGYRIFCLGNLTNNGTIKWNGNDASGATRGANLVNSSGSFAITLIGTQGGSGGTGVGAAGTASTVNLLIYGGQGGTGGTGGSGAGGAGGTKTTTSAATTSPIRWLPYAILGYTFQNDGSYRSSQAGTGGGSGAGDGVNSGGGGGSGAGIIIISSLTITGTGTLQTKGGAGGNASAGNCGGGGGGGGGLIVVISRSVSAGAISGQTIDVSGGTAGTSVGSGGSAQQGNSGASILLKN